jgi:hypothetical protein
MRSHLVADSTGNIYFADNGNNVVRHSGPMYRQTTTGCGRHKLVVSAGDFESSRLAALCLAFGSSMHKASMAPR